MSIPGFSTIHYAVREANSKGKGSGGTALFCKDEIAKHVTPIKRSDKDVIWVKIDKKLCGSDIYVGTVYFSPTGRKNDISNKFQKLREEIMLFQGKGSVILQGDFNARTGLEDDRIILDRFMEDFEVGDNHTLPPRNSEDRSPVNTRGEELLELCKSHELIILNGRKMGDPWGKMTSFQWNGSAVVDYVLVSIDIYKNISSFKVGDYSPWVSDHCPLLFEMPSLGPLEKTCGQKLEKLPNSYYFEPNDRLEYVESLEAPTMIEELSSLCSMENLGAQELTTKITETLIDTCDKAGIKAKKYKQKREGNEPWFDNECEKLQLSLKRKCRKLRQTPEDKKLNASIMKDNKLFRELVKRKKENYKQGIIQDMSLKKGNKKAFWKLLDKLGTKKPNVSKRYISGKRWNEHFKNILVNEVKEPVYPPDCPYEGPLDYPIEMGELERAAYVLRPNKSSGIDLVSNEMILGLMEAMPNLLIMLFNRVFTNNVKIDEWSTALIVPIFKNGFKMDPNNYRGISLLSCLGKFFTSILNQRLPQHVINNNILSKEQLGFVQGNRTSDAHIILSNLLQLYCHKKGEKIFSCFVDFSKAFDSIPRDKLLSKLKNFGVCGKFFNILKTLYINDTCQVKLEDGLTKPFKTNQGVKQGCILSPLLFNIYLSDLTRHIDGDDCKPVKLPTSYTISSIIWADDLVLFSETEDGLKCMLNHLADYSKENGMRINPDKTESMIFNKSGKFFRRCFTMGNEQIFTTNSYKYLGFLVTPSGETLSGLRNLKDRALKAYYKLRKTMGSYFRLYPTVTLHLFDTLIKPILLYNSDFWGCLKPSSNNPIENTHMRFCKDLLGVQRQTTNAGVLLEVGRIPIMLYAKKNCIKDWGRVHLEGKANNILLTSHINSIENDSKWSNAVQGLLDRIGIGGNTDNRLVHLNAMKRMTDIFHQEAFAKINSEGSKLRNYAKFKLKVGYERYLSSMKSVTKRTAVTKIRLSNHDLMIEKGRHQGLELNQRHCPLCLENSEYLLEDELHLLLVCNTFSHFRETLFGASEQCIQRFQYLNKEEKLKNLLSNENIMIHTGEFLIKALGVRTFLLNKHKNRI